MTKTDKLKWILPILSFALIIACSDDADVDDSYDSTDEVTLSATSVSFDEESQTIDVGETLQLEYTIEPTGADDVTFSSEDESIVTIDEDGIVTGVSAGSANVTISTTDGLLSDACLITVVDDELTNDDEEDDEPKISVTIGKTAITLNVGDDPYELTYTVDPADTADLEVSWKSSDESVATIDDDGFVTPLSAGTTTIKIVDVDSGEYYDTQCVVTVEPKLVSVESATINKPEIGIDINGFSTLTIESYTPDYAYPVPTFTWKSDNTEVATVNETTGKVVGVAQGGANINLMCDEEVMATCEVTVSGTELAIQLYDYIYSDGTFSTTYYSDDDATGIVYKIDNEKQTAMVVSLDQADYTVTWGATVYLETDEFDGRENMATIQGLGISSYPAYEWCASLNGSVVPTYASGETGVWYFPALYELCELYANFSGYSLVLEGESNVSSKEVSYREWIPECAYSSDVSMQMPGAKEADAIAARVALNERITAAGGTKIADNGDEYNPGSGTQTSYYSSTDVGAAYATRLEIDNSDNEGVDIDERTRGYGLVQFAASKYRTIAYTRAIMQIDL